MRTDSQIRSRWPRRWKNGARSSERECKLGPRTVDAVWVLQETGVWVHAVHGVAEEVVITEEEALMVVMVVHSVDTDHSAVMVHSVDTMEVLMVLLLTMVLTEAHHTVAAVVTRSTDVDWSKGQKLDLLPVLLTQPSSLKLSSETTPTTHSSQAASSSVWSKMASK